MENEANSRNAHVLSFTQRLAYSVGHVFNDLCAAFWFTYLLVFMHLVNDFKSSTAGTLMLVGQLADGIATPFIGLECDRNLDWWLCRYGKRKTWHLVGTLACLFSFPFIFHLCIMCDNAPETSQMVYYAAFIIIFQFGWAAVQISHLSLIADLTPISSERVELNAKRYAFTVISNIAAYVMILITLGQDDEGADSHISRNDALAFEEVAFIILGIGSVFSILFHIGVREKPSNQNRAICNESNQLDTLKSDTPMSWKCWLREAQFYKVALLYMGTRLTINLTQVYIPNYVQETLELPKKSVGYIPLVSYVSGFVSSFIMKYINVRLGKRITYLIGACLTLIACAWIYFSNYHGFKEWGIFGVAIVIGLASSTILITSLAITNDMIGQNTQSGAFVFGAMSFVDKVSNGVAVWLIEYVKPSRPCHDSFCVYYYQNVLTFVCGGSIVLSLIALGLLSRGKIGHLKRNGD